MKITADDFRRKYASLSNEELLAIRKDDLTDVARGCYEEEVACRRLAKAPARDRETPIEAEPTEVTHPEPGEVDEPLAVATFTNHFTANQARALLRGSGIPCYLENEHGWNKEALNLRLMVPASYFEPARILLPEEITEDTAPVEPEPWDGELAHRFVETNGIRMHYAEAGAGPLVVLLHGFPESWYSWRHQLRALAAEGYHVVAPDLRGYGQTDRPEPLEAYDILQLAGDIVGLVQAIGEQPAVIAGHDWGAWIAPHAAMLRGDLFRAVALLSVPFTPRRTVNETQWEQQKYPGKVFYQAMLRAPAAEQFMEKDIRGRLLAGLWTLSGDVREANRWKPVRDPSQEHVSAALPSNLPAWLTKQDLDFLEGEYQRTGFTGGLNYYRNMDRNWVLTPFLDGAKLLQRTIFIAGERDPVLEFLDEEYAALETNVPNLWRKVLIPGAGHWIQQERPAEVNRLLVEFLRNIEAGARAAA